MYLSKKILIRLFANKTPRTDFDFSHLQSVLIRPVGDAVGDAVANCAYAAQIKHAYPHCKLGIFVTPRNRDVLALCPHFDELIDDTPASYFHQRKKWQVLLDFYESFYSINIALDSLLAPEISIIFHKRDKKYYTIENVKNYDFHCPPPPHCHMADRLVHSVLARGRELPQAKFELTLPENEIATAQQAWQPNTVRVLLAPQGSYYKRRIPTAELAELLNRIPAADAARTEFLLCRARFSETYLRYLRARCRADIRLTLAPPTNVREYIGLVAAADIAVCVDSGSVHLACAFSRPLLAFYAHLPDNIALWQPRPNAGVPYQIIFADTGEISKSTRHFPLDAASQWLNAQIAEHITRLKDLA